MKVLEKIDGVTEELHFSEADNTFLINRVADVEPNIDANRAAQNNGEGYSPTRELRRIASVPVTIQHEWIKRYGVDPFAPAHHDLLRRLLNDPEWRYLRVSTGAF